MGVGVTGNNLREHLARSAFDKNKQVGAGGSRDGLAGSWRVPGNTSWECATCSAFS